MPFWTYSTATPASRLSTSPMHVTHSSKLNVQPTLFGDFAVVKELGRIGRANQVHSSPYPSPIEAHGALARHKAVKERRGFVSIKTVFKSICPDPGRNQSMHHRRREDPQSNMRAKC